MRFIIGARIYGLEIGGTTTGDADELGSTHRDGLFLAREQTQDEAKAILSTLYLYIAINGPAGSVVTAMAAGEANGRALADGKCTIETAKEYLDEFDRQFDNQGGDAQLADDMGLPSRVGFKLGAVDLNLMDAIQRRRWVIRRHYAGHLNDELFEVYEQQYTALGLDPIRRECVPKIVIDPDTKRPTVQIIVTLVAMIRIAYQTGRFRGFSGVEWYDDNGEPHKVWLQPGKNPVAAKVDILFNDGKAPVAGTADWASKAVYHTVNGTSFPARFWAKDPTGMIAKCAKANGLRLAFPEVAGLFIFEEMEQDRPTRRDAQHRPRDENDELRGALATLPARKAAAGLEYAEQPAPGDAMARLKQKMLDYCPTESAADAILDQVLEQWGATPDDDSFNTFAEQVMSEVKRRYPRRR